MALKVTSWNINSVRLRADQVLRHIDEVGPDIVCLQETKCPDSQFPSAAFRSRGYVHIATNGQKGYHGVAILSRIPFSQTGMMAFCGQNDCRHISVRLPPRYSSLEIHNFYVPAGGDIPDPELNPKFRHKLDFLAEMQDWITAERPADRNAVLLGDLNIAPLRSDVWNHKALLNVVSHTPVETDMLETIRSSGGFVDAVRALAPEPEPIFTWWSYRAKDYLASNRGRRLDHIWLSPSVMPALQGYLVSAQARGWERPSDHVPVTVTLDM
ncbi:exodeoxyribonuclease III [Camelimonas abortus]|uniref:Exodeoxyribonuclease III n=1 Tax=Camelimonas abortus TaxID=1017184 RepID=A0ABV7LD36_9HYPH